MYFLENCGNQQWYIKQLENKIQELQEKVRKINELEEKLEKLPELEEKLEKLPELEKKLQGLLDLYISSTPVLAILDYTCSYERKDGSELFVGNIHFHEVTITTDPEKNRLWHFRFGGEIVASKCVIEFQFNPNTTVPIGDQNLKITQLNFMSAFYPGNEYVQGHITVNNVAINFSYLPPVANFTWDDKNALFKLYFNLERYPDWEKTLMWNKTAKDFDPKTFKDTGKKPLNSANGSNSVHAELYIRDAACPETNTVYVIPGENYYQINFSSTISYSLYQLVYYLGYSQPSNYADNKSFANYLITNPSWNPIETTVTGVPFVMIIPSGGTYFKIGGGLISPLLDTLKTTDILTWQSAKDDVRYYTATKWTDWITMPAANTPVAPTDIGVSYLDTLMVFRFTNHSLCSSINKYQYAIDNTTTWYDCVENKFVKGKVSYTYNNGIFQENSNGFGLPDLLLPGGSGSAQINLPNTNLPLGVTKNLYFRSVNNNLTSAASTNITITPVTKPSDFTLSTDYDYDNKTIILKFSNWNTSGNTTPYTGGYTINKSNGFWMHYVFSENNGATGTSYVDCVDVTTTTATIENLNNGSTYSITIRAKNTLGNSSSKTLANLIPCYSLQPTNAAVVCGDNIITISYNPPTKLAKTAISKYRYSLDGTNYTDVPSDKIITSGVLNNISYTIKVAAFTNGLGLTSSVTFQMGTAPPPTGISIVDITLGVVKLTFTQSAVYTKFNPITSYQYSKDNKTTWSSCASTNLQGTTCTITINNLTQGTFYIFLRAVQTKDNISTYGNPSLSFTVNIPYTPTNMSVQETTVNSVKIKVSQNNIIAIGGYKFSLDNINFTNSNLTSIINSGSGTVDNTITISNLSVSSTYTIYLTSMVGSNVQSFASLVVNVVLSPDIYFISPVYNSITSMQIYFKSVNSNFKYYFSYNNSSFTEKSFETSSSNIKYFTITSIPNNQNFVYLRCSAVFSSTTVYSSAPKVYFPVGSLTTNSSLNKSGILYKFTNADYTQNLTFPLAIGTDPIANYGSIYFALVAPGSGGGGSYTQNRDIYKISGSGGAGGQVCKGTMKVYNNILYLSDVNIPTTGNTFYKFKYDSNSSNTITSYAPSNGQSYAFIDYSDVTFSTTSSTFVQNNITKYSGGEEFRLPDISDSKAGGGGPGTGGSGSTGASSLQRFPLLGVGNESKGYFNSSAGGIGGNGCSTIFGTFGAGGSGGANVNYAFSNYYSTNITGATGGSNGQGGQGGNSGTYSSSDNTNGKQPPETSFGSGGGGGGCSCIWGQSQAVSASFKSAGGGGRGGVLYLFLTDPIILPGPPTITSATINDRTISFNFTPGSTNGGTITGYKYGVSSNNGTSYTYTTINSTTSSITISEAISYNTLYTLILQAQSSGGFGAFGSPYICNFPPTAPTLLTTLTEADQSVTLPYTLPVDNRGVSIEYFEYSYVNDGTQNFVNFTRFTTFNLSGSNNLSLQNLTNGTTYSAVLRAGNKNGSSVNSNIVSFTPCTIPSAPTITQLTRGNGSLSIAFTIPTNNGGSTITGYQYSYSSDNGTSYSTPVSVTTLTSPISISGLKNTTSYSVKLAAMNKKGAGSYSNIVTSASVTVPTAPTITSSTVKDSDRTISLYFTLPLNNGGLEITGYKYGLSSNNGTSYTYTTINSTTSPITISQGITIDTLYTVILQAQNLIGLGTSSFSFTCNLPPSPPTLSTSITEGDAQVIIPYTTNKVSLNGRSTYISYYDYSYVNDGTQNFVNFVRFYALNNDANLFLQNLTNGTTYNVVLRTGNNYGTSVNSNVISFTPGTTPSAPTITQITPGNLSLSIAFTIPTSNGGYTITGYNYTYSTNNGTSYSTPVSVTTLTSPISITSLTNGTSYSVKIAAVNKKGTGTYSNIVTAVPATVPSTPTITSVTPGNQLVVCTFTAPSNNGGSAITSYEYAYQTATQTSAYSTLPTTPTSFTVSGLSNGTSYQILLRAVNSIGSGSSTTSSSFSPAAVPTAPTINSVLAGNGFVTLNFTAATSSSSLTEYKYGYSSNNGSTYTYNTTTNVSSTSITISSLTNNSLYMFVLLAKNTVGYGPSASFLGAYPSAPTVTNSSVASSQIILNITTQNNGGSSITKYTISYTTSLSQTSQSLELPFSTTTNLYTVPNLTDGLIYSFTCKGTNQYGTGSLSSALSINAVPKSPIFTSSTLNSLSITIRFTAPTINYVSISGYKYRYKLSSASDYGATYTTISSTSSFTISGLTNGTSYDIQLVAYNSSGNSAPLQILNQIPRTTPGAPTSLSWNSTTRLLTFTAPVSNGGAAITNYAIYTTSGVKTELSPSQTSSPLNLSSLTLTSGTLYQLAAVNSAGTGTRTYFTA